MGKNIWRTLGYILRGIRELIYPMNSRCIICHKEEEEGLCNTCFSKITLCKKEDFAYGYYTGVLKELIIKFKFKKDFNAGFILTDLLNDKISKYANDYIVTYIPVSNNGKENRGFDQCRFLAKEVAFINNRKIENTLFRVKETKEQKLLNHKERLGNMQGAFKSIENVNGKKYLLIDDVYTTGATILEGVRALKENGAVDIKILTLAKSCL